MAGMQKGKSSLSALIKAHKNDETVVRQDFVDLPGGISSDEGRAQLKTAYRAQYKEGENKGEYYIRMSATVLAPEKAVRRTLEWSPDPKPNGSVKVVSTKEVRVKGLQTSIMLPLCATGKGDRARTMEENVKAALNEIRTIGGEDCLDSVDTDEDLDELLASLAKSGIVIKFGTRDSKMSKEYPTQKVFETWYGADTSWEGAPASEPEDNTGESNEASGSEPLDPGDEDLDALAAAASSDDTDTAEEAATRLTELAKEAGVTEDEIENAEDWTEVVSMIAANRNADGQFAESEEVESEEKEESEPEGDPEPKKGALYRVRLIDPKTGKPYRKPSQVEVLGVNSDQQTVTLKNLDTGKTIVDAKTKKPQAFAWSDLLPDE